MPNTQVEKIKLKLAAFDQEASRLLKSAVLSRSTLDRFQGRLAKFLKEHVTEDEVKRMYSHRAEWDYFDTDDSIASKHLTEIRRYIQGLFVSLEEHPDEVVVPPKSLQDEPQEIPKGILEAVLSHFLKNQAFPNNKKFRADHRNDRTRITELTNEHFLRINNDRLELTLKGLQSLNTREGLAILKLCQELIPALQEAYGDDPEVEIVVTELASKLKKPPSELTLALFFLLQLHFYTSMSGYLPERFKMDERILDIDNLGAEITKQAEKQSKASQFLLNNIHFSPAIRTNPAPPLNNKSVFVIHGHDEVNKMSLVNFLKAAGLNPIVLASQPNLSQALIEKLEREGSKVAYAICLMTGDDCIKAKKSDGTDYHQPRPNVIFELGWFFAKLARERVCILEQSNIKLHTDIKGIVTCRFDENVSEIFTELTRELRSVGLIEDSPAVTSGTNSKS